MLTFKESVMNAINIRPVTDLRNKYPDVESDVQKGR